MAVVSEYTAIVGHEIENVEKNNKQTSWFPSFWGGSTHTLLLLMFSSVIEILIVIALILIVTYYSVDTNSMQIYEVEELT